MDRNITDKLTCGFISRAGSLWVGVHWSGYNRRFCINLLPCCTFWIVLPGGAIPDKKTK